MRQGQAELRIRTMMAALNQKLQNADGDYAVKLLHRVCCLAGEPEFLTHRSGGRKTVSPPPLSGTTPLPCSIGWCRR